ncbi:MAG: DUF4421 domain-containing protein [Panacibacter sp.]
MKRKRCFYLSQFVITTLLLLNTYSSKAQESKNTGNDSNYYVTYPQMLTTRFYFSQKYTAFTLQGKGDIKDLQYCPNTTLNMGVGATYHNFSLNLAYGFGFLNQDKEKGKTKYLDLQGHFYPKNWVVDWYGELYKGYYLYPKGFAAISPDNYYVRRDAKVNLFGIAAYRVLNNKRFSYNAAMIQNEWQKKSAGSLLLGAETYYGVMKADSAWVPTAVAANYGQAGINDIKFFSIGPGVGYAYTLVIKQHFFAMGSLAVNLNLGFSSESGIGSTNNKTAVNATALYRMAAGYNSNKWNVSVNWVGNRLPVSGAANNYLSETGNYRIILAKKIMPGPGLRKPLHSIDRILK